MSQSPQGHRMVTMPSVGESLLQGNQQGSQGVEDAQVLVSFSGLAHASAENTDVCENVSLQRA